MAHIRIGLSWRRPWLRRKSAAKADASFFEGAAKRHPGPDGLAAGVFTPAEEAESHRRWRRALLSRRFRRPVSGAERLGFGLSAAALAALVDREKRSDAAGEADGRPQDDNGDVGEVLAALKSAAAFAAPPDKAPITAKGAGAAQAFLDSGGDELVSSRADGAAAPRRAAPRGSGGAPAESRVGGSGAERSDGASLRKPDQASGEGRAPSLAEGAFTIRAGMEAEVVTMAIAMGAVVAAEAREDREQTVAKATHAAEAKANQGGRAPAEAPGQAKGKDEPSTVADLKADGRQDLIEAFARDRADAPAVAETRTAHHQSRSAEEAPGRLKAKDAAVGADRVAVKDQDADEAPMEARAKDADALGEARSGFGQKPIKAPLQAKVQDTEVVQAKDAAPDRRAPEAPVQPKAKDAAATPVSQSKADPLRDQIEAPAQPTGQTFPGIVEVEAGQGQGISAAAGRSKANDSVLAGKADQGQALVEASAATAAKGVPANVEAKVEAPGPMLAKNIPPAIETKSEVGQRAAEAPGPVPSKGAAAAAEAPGPVPPKGAAAAAEAKAEVGQRAAVEPVPEQAKAKDAALHAVKAEPTKAPVEAASTTKTAVVEAKVDPGLVQQAAPPGQGKAIDLPAVGNTQAGAGRDQTQAPGQAKTAAVTEVRTDVGAGQAEALAQPKAKDVSVDASTAQPKTTAAPVVEAKSSDQAQRTIEAPGPVKDVPATIETKANPGQGSVETPAQTKIVLPAVEAKPDLGARVADALGDAKAKDVVPAVGPDKAALGQHTAEAPVQEAKSVPIAVAVKAEPSPAPGEARGQPAVGDVPAAIGAKVEAPDHARLADLPGAQAPEPAQHAPALAKGGDVGVAPGVASADLPASAVTLHVTDLWPGAPSLAPDQAALSVPLPALPVVAGGAPGTAAGVGLAGDVTTSVSFGLGETGTGTIAAPVETAAAAGPTGAGPQSGATIGLGQTATPGDAAGGALLASPVEHGPGGQAPALGELLAALSATPPEGAGGQMEGGPLLLERMELDVAALDGASRSATGDLAIL